MFILYAVLFIITVAIIANLIFVTIMGWDLGKSKIRLASDIFLILILLVLSVSYLDQVIDTKTESTFNKMSLSLED